MKNCEDCKKLTGGYCWKHQPKIKNGKMKIEKIGKKPSQTIGSVNEEFDVIWKAINELGIKVNEIIDYLN